MLILVCPVCKSTMQVLVKTAEGDLSYKCYNETCPSYAELIALKDVTEECIKETNY